MSTGRWLGVDFGRARIGIAVSDPGARLARGLETVRWSGGNLERPLERVLAIAREQQAVGIVVGLPRRTDGRPGESEALARSFAALLEQRSGLPVSLSCERYTTALASRFLHESGHKSDRMRSIIDQVAAEILLQDFLDQARRSAEPCAIITVDSSVGPPEGRTRNEEDMTMTADKKNNIPGMNADEKDLEKDCDCVRHEPDCGCDDMCDCGADWDENGCDCGYDDDFDGESVITMTDTETGEDYRFILADDFIFEDENYCVLVSEDTDEPELVIARVVELEDGSEGLETLNDDEYDRVYAEYERICEEDEEEEDDEVDEVSDTNDKKR